MRSVAAAANTTPDASAIEARIRSHADAGQHDLAATVAIESYGAELLRFLAAMLRDETAASDVFAQTCEDLWRGLPQMRWHSSFRTWCFSVARNACYRHLRNPNARRAVPLSASQEVEKLVITVRAATQPYLRTSVKDAFARLRETLTPDEQSLLTLRIDRDLDWSEIAQILSDEPLDPPGVKRAAAACRKRFERLTEKLRELAEQAGLLEEDG
jgi:RNA polymerase sigma-70 factor (ECF subfamily)